MICLLFAVLWLALCASIAKDLEEGIYDDCEEKRNSE